MTVRTTKEIGADLCAAVAAVQAWQDVTNQQVRDVKAAREDGASALRQKAGELRREHNEAQDAEALANAHPWTGKVVTRVKPLPNRRPWTTTPDPVLTGVVEIATNKSRWPGNIADYKYPSVGTAFVRLHKADGTLGLAFEALKDAPANASRPETYWHLKEGE